MKKNLLPPVIALLGGGVGLALRRWQLAAGFEAETGLPLSGAPANLALPIWSVLVALALVLLCRGRRMSPQWETALDAQGKPIFLTACVLAGFLLLGSAVGEWLVLAEQGLTGNTWGSRMLPPLRMVLCVLGCLCTVFWTRDLSRRAEEARQSVSILELCLLFCIWLISDFRTRAIDPITQNYLYEVLAIVCALLALYYLAGYSFQTGKPRRTAVACMLGVYFSLVTLADGHSLADICRYGFIILFLTAHAALLLTSPEEPAEEKTEAENNG